MPYADKSKEAEYQHNRWIESKAKRAGKVETRERTSGDVRGKPYNPGPWPGKDLRPWERLGIK